MPKVFKDNEIALTTAEVVMYVRAEKYLQIGKLTIIALANILLAIFIGIDTAPISTTVGVPELIRNAGVPIVLFQAWAAIAGVYTLLSIAIGGKLLNPNGIHFSALFVYITLGLYASVTSPLVPLTIIATYSYVFLDILLTLVNTYILSIDKR